MISLNKYYLSILLIIFSISYSQQNKLKDMDIKDVRELEQDMILDIQNSVICYIEELEIKFKIKLDFKDINTLNCLDEKIFQYGLNNLDDRDLFMISIYLDEFFRNNTEDTYWALDEFKTKNGKYFVPYLKRIKSIQEFSFYRDIFKGHFENESGYLLLKYLYISQLANYKGLVPLSEEEINFFRSFE
jgi:hypothetical protein